jgi:hypothetical protein
MCEENMVNPELSRNTGTWKSRTHTPCWGWCVVGTVGEVFIRSSLSFCLRDISQSYSAASGVATAPGQ